MKTYTVMFTQHNYTTGHPERVTRVFPSFNEAKSFTNTLPLGSYTFTLTRA